MPGTDLMFGEEALTSIVLALLLTSTYLFAEESRTYMVNTSSIAPFVVTTKGIATSNPQPLYNTKVAPVSGSAKCVVVELLPSDADIAFLDSLEAAGSIVLLNKSMVYNYPDPATGELKTQRDYVYISSIPSYCFDVAIASKGVTP